jgi:hypothetical protein
MTLSVAGETQTDVKLPANPLLAPDWYKELSPPQLMGYIRHSYIWRSTGSTNLTSPEQAHKNVRWDGGEDSFGCKFTPVWPRILKMITSYNAEPGIWVAAHFSPLANVMSSDASGSFEIREISPTHLCSKTSAKLYQDYCDYFPKAIAEKCETAMRSVVLRIKSLSKLPLTRSAQYACAVCDESHVTATPFFRHAIAANAEAHEAAEKYLWPSAFDYEAQQRLYAGVPPWCCTKELMNAVLTIRTHWRRT